MFNFRRITLCCLEKHLSKHKMTMFSENLGRAMAPLAPPWLRLCESYVGLFGGVHYLLKAGFNGS